MEQKKVGEQRLSSHIPVSSSSKRLCGGIPVPSSAWLTRISSLTLPPTFVHIGNVDTSWSLRACCEARGSRRKNKKNLMYVVMLYMHPVRCCAKYYCTADQRKNLLKRVTNMRWKKNQE